MNKSRQRDSEKKGFLVVRRMPTGGKLHQPLRRLDSVRLSALGLFPHSLTIKRGKNNSVKFAHFNF